MPLADTHGDVVAAFTVNGAGLTDQKVFDPFGVPTTAGSANVRVGFQGSWTDPTTAKVSAEARWYTPGTGGFVSRDSAGLPLTSGISANRYVYGNANPLAFNDPSGHSFLRVVGRFEHSVVNGVKAGGRAVGSIYESVSGASLSAEEAILEAEMMAGSSLSWTGVGLIVVGLAVAGTVEYFALRGSSQPVTNPNDFPAPDPNGNPNPGAGNGNGGGGGGNGAGAGGGHGGGVKGRASTNAGSPLKRSIPPIPLPQLKPQSSAGTAVSSLPNIEWPDGSSPAGTPLDLVDCVLGTCADSLRSGDGASGQGTDGSCASAGGPSPLATTCVPDEPAPDPAAGGAGGPSGGGKPSAPPTFPDSPRNLDDGDIS
ncbi:RHS repeat-associated core domain-containing protein [Frankia sp. Cr2]|uniref:RHS repeat protein n=1 Tax=Frankia sp. Cr2 TaxID=3073932 RepID=UPI002AD1DC9C|nr:RHS repeat-associated core domain-containing protein [Frankia sp. Cr2]